MADTFETKPNNFGNTNQSHTKYLDLAGLKEFWGRVKDYIDTQDLTIYDKIKDISGLDIDDLLVIGKGDANNSAVLNGEYTISGTKYKNKALSQVSVSLGAASTAGLKGWYYSAITFGTNPVITLSDTQPYGVLGSLVGGSWSSGTPSISKGDKISIVNNAKYDYCGTVKSVAGNKITLNEALPFNSLDIGTVTVNNPDDWSIYLPEKPDAGIIDFGGGAFAEGVNTKSTNIGSHAEGIQTHAYGQYSHTEGFRTEAAYAAHAEGGETIASGTRAHAEGRETTASGVNSHAEGRGTVASNLQSHAEGRDTLAIGEDSHAEGRETVASGIHSHAEGFGTQATGITAHSEGYETEASGDYSHSEGKKTKSSNNHSHAEGFGTQALGAQSHTEGNITIAKGSDTHAEGKRSFAFGAYSHAEGFGSDSPSDAAINAENVETIKLEWESTKRTNVAVGIASHVEGRNNLAYGDRSHAGGLQTEAIGANSFAHGNNVVTTKADEVAFGKYNVSDDSTLFSLGNGTSSTRKNAFEIKTDNTAYVNGKQIATLNDIPAVDTELNPDSNNPIANSVVANAIKGGVHFKGVYKTLPTITEITDEVTEETVNGWIDPVTADVHVFDVGDIIIVEPAGDYPETVSEPTMEYILTYTNVDRYKWVELGDVTPAQGMIDESLKNYYKKSETYKKSEVDSKISSVNSRFGDYIPRETNTDSDGGEEAERVVISNQDLYGAGYDSDLYRWGDVSIEPHKITLGAHEDYMDDENGINSSRSNELEISIGHGLRFNGNEVLTADADNNLSKSELKIGQVEISNSDQQPNYTFNGRVVLNDTNFETFSAVAEWDGNDPVRMLHPYTDELVDICKFIITSINWEDNASGNYDETWRDYVEDMLMVDHGKLFISIECLNDPTIKVYSDKSWIDADIYDPSTGSINGNITVTMPYSLKKLSKLTVNGNEVLAVDNEGVLDKDTLIITDGEYNQFIVGDGYGLIANHTYKMDGETMQTMFASSPIEGCVGGVVSYASNQLRGQSGFVASGQMVHILSGGENSETGESTLTQLIVHPGGAIINEQPILTGTRIEDSKILSLFS